MRNKRTKTKDALPFFNEDEVEPGFDEEGNPVTVEAAQKFYH